MPSPARAFAYEPPETTPPPPPDEDDGGAGGGCEGMLWGCDWSGTDEGAWPGACRPRSPAFAGGGIAGIADERVLPGVERVAVAAEARPGDLDVSVFPGATADTSAAKPAVSAAAAAMTHRRVRLTRASAASRASTARD
ncbi:MAG: hypothetical protein JOZ95_02165 [Solirubrobacterales bacterium]|nr:hypothetical protein [Solirubrobacterales bacterium]